MGSLLIWPRMLPVLLRHHILHSLKLLKISPFRTNTPSKTENYPESVIKILPHPPKVKIIENHPFQDNHTLQKMNIIQKQSFQNHRILKK